MALYADRVGSQMDVGCAEIGFFGNITLSSRPRGFAPSLLIPHS